MTTIVVFVGIAVLGIGLPLGSVIGGLAWVEWRSLRRYERRPTTRCRHFVEDYFGDWWFVGPSTRRQRWVEPPPTTWVYAQTRHTCPLCPWIAEPSP